MHAWSKEIIALSNLSPLLQIISSNFTLFSRPCPGGYAMTTVPNSDTMTCTCVATIEEILFCEDDQDSVILRVSKQYSELVAAIP